MKKNKKGFTLIELLAVIAILAVIGIVVTIVVMSSYRKAKEKSEEVFKKQLVKGFESYVSLNVDSLNFTEVSDKYSLINVDFKNDILSTGVFGTNSLVNPNLDIKCESGTVTIYKSNKKQFCYQSKLTSSEGVSCLTKQINTCSNKKVDIVSSTLKDPIQSGTATYEVINNTDKFDTEFASNNKSPSAGTNYGINGLVKVDYTGSDGSTESTWIFSGTIENNYVSFANSLWRIVRINSDGSLRLISNSNLCGNSSWNKDGKEQYAGYTYLEDDIEVNSNIKTVVDNCYNSKLAKYDSYIINQSFCNEVKFDYSDSNSKYYLAGARWNLPSKKPADFACYSKFSDSGYGGEYNLKVGLLTMEEARYASISSSAYLYNNSRWWLLTPFKFYGNWGVIMFYANSNGTINSGGVRSSYGVRPVINLRSDISFSKGDGTESNPYIVKLD